MRRGEKAKARDDGWWDEVKERKEKQNEREDQLTITYESKELVLRVKSPSPPPSPLPCTPLVFPSDEENKASEPVSRLLDGIEDQRDKSCQRR